MRRRTKGYIGVAALGLTALYAWQVHAWASEEPIHAGHWSVHWMKPEPVHAIESVETNREPGDLPLLRIEIKVGT
jgi:hypothetical protein